MNTSTNSLIDIAVWVNNWPKTSDLWTIHVDELVQWQPKSESFKEWMSQLLNLYNQACFRLNYSDVLVATLSFESTKQLEKFSCLMEMKVDFFTPPTLYLLNKTFEFPLAGELYYRVLTNSESGCSISKGVVIVCSGRSTQDLANSWEFNNTLYIISDRR